jgi:hypothetical protein
MTAATCPSCAMSSKGHSSADDENCYKSFREKILERGISGSPIHAIGASPLTRGFDCVFMTGQGQRHVRFFPRRTQVPTPEQRLTPWSRARTTRSTAYAMSVAARSRAAMAATALARASITPIASDSGSRRHRVARTRRHSKPTKGQQKER